MSQLRLQTLDSSTTLASTLGETSSTSQVLPKGLVVRVFLVHFCSIEPWVFPCANIYEDLKTFDTDIIQHKIPMKVVSNPFRQKIRKFNPMVMSIIEKELKRMLDARIIVPLRYLDWVSNLVPMRKKSGEIRLCVDFLNINKCSLKENHPLPKMDHILKTVVAAHKISLLDRYSGYNQIAYV
jgi:hypothetical protein